ncbi:MAG: universal stress protein [Saprospiraceae bacterium]|nr:universal stress protein [Saprospiraceae bacterium]
MKRILFASDLSDSGMNALKYTLALTKDTGISIDLLHVFDIPVIVASSLPQTAISTMINERSELVLEDLKELQKVIPENQQGKLDAVYGPYPASEIVHVATENEADIIVMALRQKYSFIDRLMGTVTAQTIALSNIPVLAIPSGASFTGIHKILFPTAIAQSHSLPEKEEKALQWLYNFWSIFKYPSIHLLHIDNDADEGTDITFKHKPFSETDFTVSHAKSLEAGIIDYVKKEKAELIALYKPHRSFWERLYHSSVTRKLLFKSRIPLLVFS